MTSLHLLLWIAGGILLQLVLYMCIGFWHHWQAYTALRHVTTELDFPIDHARTPADVSSITTWPGYRTFIVQRKSFEDAAKLICSFYLVPEDGRPLANFLPGQYLTFAFDVTTPTSGTQSITRCYSLSDAPRSSHYRISVKRALAAAGGTVAEGLASNYLHDHVAVGSRLQVRAPKGHFHIDNSDTPVVLIAGGIGITPMLSMLNWCMETLPQREVWLFYGVRCNADLAMQAHLEDLASQHQNFHLHVCMSDADADASGVHSAAKGERHHSRVNVTLLRQKLPLKPYHFYICGPTSMLQSLVPALEDWGVPDGRIHFEAFGPASIPRKGKDSTAQLIPEKTQAVLVTFAKSGRKESWLPGMGSLLEFAQAQGIVVNSGCRAGGCGSCQTSIRSGEVTYTQTPDFDPEPGSCLPCVCTPKTAVTLEA